MLKHDKTSLLIVCRTMNDIAFVRKIGKTDKRNIIVASDDILVQETCRQFPWVDGVCWLEQMESFYKVADDVIHYLNEINLWLKNLGDNRNGISPDLIFWFKQVEGGMTTQRIQDVLLLIRSYSYLFDMHNISNAIIIKNPNTLWEDDIFIHTALYKKIGVTVLGEYRISILFKKLKLFLKYLLREPYNVFNIVYIKLAMVKKESHLLKNNNNEIVFQLCGSAEKHVENIISIMKEVKKKGYHPIALCWKASDGAREIKKSGLIAENLEKCVPIISLWQGIIRTFRIWGKASVLRENFFENHSLNYKSIPIGQLLWPSIKNFIFAELPQRYRLDLAIKKYLKYHSPVGVKLWGGGKLIEGDLILKNINMTKKPLLMYWFWFYFDSPYESDMDYIDLFLTVGKCQERYLKEIVGVSLSNVVSVGLSRYDNIPILIKEYNPEKSRFYIKVPSKYSMYIFYDPNVVLRGYLASSEQVQLTDFLLKFVKNFQHMALIIKPHPSHSSGMLEVLVKRYALKNVFIVDKRILAYHAINASDLVITKISSIGLEGMLFKRPIISVLLDKEVRWKNYGNAATYITDIAELNNLLTHLVKDEHFKSAWTKDQINKQKEFLDEYFIKGDKSVAALSAEAIDDYISKKNLTVSRAGAESN